MEGAQPMPTPAAPTPTPTPDSAPVQAPVPAPEQAPDPAPEPSPAPAVEPTPEPMQTAKEGRRTISTKRSRGFIIVVMTAVFAGIMLVLALFLIRSAIFNAQLLAERDKALENFSQTQDNINDLRKKVDSLKTNENLEFLAGEKGIECYDDNGELIREYTKISQAQSCSSIRTLNDAIPLKRNDEKTLAEVNRLLSAAGVSLDKLSMNNDEKVKTNIANARTMAIEVAFTGSAEQIKRALQNLEKSIRQFDVREINVSAQNGGKLRADTKITAYYTTEAAADIQEKTMKTGLNGVIWNSLNAKEEK